VRRNLSWKLGLRIEIDITETIARMAADTQRHMAEAGRAAPLMIGIARGGVWVAERLHQLLDLQEKLGQLNITFYRDDFQRIGLHPSVGPSVLPVTLDGRHIVLVDDVLYTGRTIRAALNVLFDYGRPASVTLVALVDRGGRELPMCADITGHTLQLQPDEYLSIPGPDFAWLEITKTPPSEFTLK